MLPPRDVELAAIATFIELYGCRPCPTRFCYGSMQALSPYVVAERIAAFMPSRPRHKRDRREENNRRVRRLLADLAFR
jgi:hypothetical protein